MPEVQPFHRARVEAYLLSNQLTYSTDAEGNFYVEYERDEECGCTLTVFLIVDEEETVYSIQVESDRRFSASDWGRCVWVCNTWNRESGYPMAYLDAGDPDAAPPKVFSPAPGYLGASTLDLAAEIRLEQSYELKEGIHQELLDALTTEAIDGAFEFWRWAHTERNL